MDDLIPPKPPVPERFYAARIVGGIVGCYLSITLVYFQHWTTHHSRRYLPVARAIAAHDVQRGIDLLSAFESEFRADRLLETERMRPVLALLSVAGAAKLQDRAALDHWMKQYAAFHDRWVRSEAGSSHWPRSASEVLYPLPHSTSFAIGAAILKEDWPEAIRLASDALQQNEKFWADFDYPSGDLDSTVPGSNYFTVRLLRGRAGYCRAVRAWAYAQIEDDPAALADISETLRDASVWRKNDDDLIAGLYLLQAAIHHRMRDEQASETAWENACKESGSPTTADPRIILWRQWEFVRSRKFGLPLLWANSETSDHKWIWSWRENPRDLVDDYLADRGTVP